jgi:hypothetical protein
VLLVAIVAAMEEVEVLVKGQYAFRAFRNRKTQAMTVVELEQILRCSYLSWDPEEMSAKANRLLEALPSPEISLEDFEELCNSFPAALFPYGGKDASSDSSDD